MQKFIQNRTSLEKFVTIILCCIIVFFFLCDNEPKLSRTIIIKHNKRRVSMSSRGDKNTC